MWIDYKHKDGLEYNIECIFCVFCFNMKGFVWKGTGERCHEMLDIFPCVAALVKPALCRG